MNGNALRVPVKLNRGDEAVVPVGELSRQSSDINERLRALSNRRAEPVQAKNPLSAQFTPPGGSKIWLFEDVRNGFVVEKRPQKEDPGAGAKEAAQRWVASHVLADPGMERLVLRRSMQVPW